MTHAAPDSVLPLSLEEGVQLAHALVHRVATEANIRVLFVKGITLQNLGLRQPRRVADVDVLVEPGRVTDLTRHLEALGWHERPRLTLPTDGIENATTLVHQEWPCDLDLHGWMRGVYAKSDDVFAVLWSERQYVPVAGTNVTTPSHPSALLLAAVNCLREPYAPQKQAELDQLVESFGNLGHQDQLQLVHRARDFRTLTTGRPFLAELSSRYGVAVELRNDLTQEQMDEWVRTTIPEQSIMRWWYTVRHVGWRRGIAITLRFIWPDEYTLVRSRGAVPAGDLSRTLARLRRIGSGIAKIPTVIRHMRARRKSIDENEKP